jgi:3-oxoacyl-[acyl-carrier protein] reductase
MELQEKIAIVTGAARGIGRTTAVSLARAGARAVALVDVNESALADTAREVSKAGAEALPLACDVSDLESLRAMFARVDAAYGRLDVLHNNAGIGEGAMDWPDVPPERAGAIVDVNLRGVVLGTRLALEPMQRSGGGAVVNTASGAAFVPLPPQAVYAATKAAVVHFTKACAPLAGSHGVRVNCVCPGLVDTPMVRDSGRDGQPHPWLQKAIDGLGLLDPQEIADAVLDLIRDDTKAGEIVQVNNHPG